MPLRLCYLPAKFSIDCGVEGNRIRQLLHPAILENAEAIPYTRGRQNGELLTIAGRNVMVLPKRLAGGSGPMGEVLITPDGKAPLSSESQVRIPVKWATDSGDVGQGYFLGRVSIGL
jgi:hypothetical protein